MWQPVSPFFCLFWTSTTWQMRSSELVWFNILVFLLVICYAYSELNWCENEVQCYFVVEMGTDVLRLPFLVKTVTLLRFLLPSGTSRGNEKLLYWRLCISSVFAFSNDFDTIYYCSDSFHRLLPPLPSSPYRTPSYFHYCRAFRLCCWDSRY